MGTLKGKVAIITGGASGIGRGTALRFAKAGAKVVIADVNEAGGQETAKMVKQAGGDITFVKADLAKNEEVQNVVGKALTTYGGIHVLHNNAAVLRTHDRLEEIPIDEWRWIVDVNLTSLFLLARAVAPMMRAAGGGAIVNMSSLAGLRGYDKGIAYGAAKAGVRGLTWSLAGALAADKIRVNAICPSGVDTPIMNFAAGPARDAPGRAALLTPDDIARAVEYLATHDTLTGASVLVERRNGKVTYLKVRDWEADVMTDLK